MPGHRGSERRSKQRAPTVKREAGHKRILIAVAQGAQAVALHISSPTITAAGMSASAQRECIVAATHTPITTVPVIAIIACSLATSSQRYMTIAAKSIPPINRTIFFIASPERE